MSGFSRRGLFQNGGWVAAALAAVRPRSLFAAPGSTLKTGADIYQSIGVRPIINCKGTFTIVSGSQSLPEVKRAMEDASRHYIHLDELMNAVSKRLAEITKAEWGIVTAGCAAALTHATAACIAGADPEKMQRLPNLDGMKNEVIMPKHSRNVYDHAVRMLGVKTVEVNSAAELERAMNAKTAMIMILANTPADSGELSTENIARLAKPRGIPVIVDAAAEKLTIPSIHLQRGATMVAYSGGKCIRGPQCAGLLLGPKDLLQAAWLNSAPHHAFGRSLKVGKEEIMGMLAAVEMWVQRDHDAEWKNWESWIGLIGDRVKRIDGITTEVLQPRTLSNHAPQLRIKWDGAKLGIAGQEAEKILYQGDPRIILGNATGNARDMKNSSLTIMPYMMMPGDAKIAAERIYAVLSKPPKIDRPAPNTAPPAQVGGQWDVEMTFTYGQAKHTLTLEQTAGMLAGTHRGEVTSGTLRGFVEGNQVQFRSRQPYEGTVLGFEFAGTVNGDRMEGTVGLEEYGQAQFTARKRA